LFHTLAARSPDNAVVDKKTFLEFLGTGFPGMLGERTFTLFDVNANNQIDIDEFLNGLSRYIHGSVDDQIKVLFQLYDVDDTKSVSQENLRTMFFSLARIPSMIPGLVEGSNGELKNADASKVRDAIDQALAFDFNHNGELSYPQFSAWIKSTPTVLELLSLSFQRHSFLVPASPRVRPVTAYRCTQPRCRWECRFCPFCGEPLTDSSGNCCPRPSCGKQIFNGRLQFCIRCGEALSIKRTVVRQQENKQGSLCTRRKRVPAFKKQHYILRDQFLYVLQNAQSENPIRLHFIGGVFFDPVNSAPHVFKNMYCFSMRTSSRTDYLYALTAEDRTSWINSLRQAALTVPITDCYDMGAQLGQGKQGKIYAATNRVTREEVAVKHIDMAGFDEKAVEHLRGEIAIMRLVEHPNIVRLRHVFEAKDSTYLVIDKAPNGDLLDLVGESFTNGKTFSELSSFKVLRQLVAVLDYLHQRGIVHRDLKLENILIMDRECNRVLVTDFGFSSFIKPGEGKELSVPGTISYLSPEVLRGSPCAPSTDLWALGVTLFALLVNGMPWKGINDLDDVALIQLIVNGEPSYHSPRWANISPEAKDVTMQLLTKDPQLRMTLDQLQAHPWYVSMQAQEAASTSASVTEPVSTETSAETKTD
jgi:Ca2+-binding EF-hand superfamily protein